MSLRRIEAVTYGVEDLPKCQRFLEDAGLELAASSDSAVSFRTPVNQYIHLRDTGDPQLPEALDGAELREVTYGVDTVEALDAFVADLRRDRTVEMDAHATAHFRDESGYGVALQVSQPHEVTIERRPTNVHRDVQRWNEERTAYGRAHPIRICHVALNVRQADWARAEAFYNDRLHFRTIDRAMKAGSFMQCEGDFDHHNLGLFHRGDENSVNHLALEVRDADEAIEGGNHLIERGWEEARPLGRHTVGSNIFRFFTAPFGGRLELVADMSRYDDRIETPRIHEETPPHHLWVLKTNIKTGVGA